MQDKVKEISESRAKATRHCYPLSGLLEFEDGSGFVGSGAWGRTCKSTYYYNKDNKIRVRTEIFEAEAQKILSQVADNAPEFQKSIANYAAQQDSSIELIAGKISEIDRRLDELAEERQRLDQRLSFLLEDDDLEMARSFRGEYKERVLVLKNEERELECRKKQFQVLQKQLKEARDTNKTGWLGQANAALNFLKKKDMLPLRSAYRQIFAKIVVRRLDAAKVRLQFFFKDLSTAISNGEVVNCTTAGLVAGDGFEPPTFGL